MATAAVETCRPIRLLRLWRRRPIGTIIDTFPHGVAATMVRAHIAEWADGLGDSAPSTAGKLSRFNRFRQRKAEKSAASSQTPNTKN